MSSNNASGTVKYKKVLFYQKKDVIPHSFAAEMPDSDWLPAFNFIIVM